MCNIIGFIWYVDSPVRDGTKHLKRQTEDDCSDNGSDFEKIPNENKDPGHYDKGCLNKTREEHVRTCIDNFSKFLWFLLADNAKTGKLTWIYKKLSGFPMNMVRLPVYGSHVGGGQCNCDLLWRCNSLQWFVLATVTVYNIFKHVQKKYVTSTKIAFKIFIHKWYNCMINQYGMFYFS